MHDQDPLDDLFRQARANPPQPSDDFMARVLADALAHQPQPRPLTPAVAVKPRIGFWRRLMTVLGGATAIAGIGSAAIAGVFIGYVQPESLASVATTFGISTTSESLELLPGFDSLLTEE